MLGFDTIHVPVIESLPKFYLPAKSKSPFAIISISNKKLETKIENGVFPLVSPQFLGFTIYLN